MSELSVMKIEHAQNHAAYDVLVDGTLVGRIPYIMLAADAQSFLGKARHLPKGEVLKCRVFALVEAPE